MRTWEQFLEDKLTPIVRRDCVVQYEILRKDGKLGSCLLRDIAQSWCNETGSTDVVRVMQDITNDCYRYFAMKYFADREFW